MFEKFKENRQLAKLAKSDNWEDRAEAARRGYKPEKLAYDNDERVRMALAENSRKQLLSSSKPVAFSL